MAWEEVTIGQCRLILEDALEVLPTLEPVSAVITDPPYGVGLIGKKTRHATHRPAHLYPDMPADVLPCIHHVLEWSARYASCAVVTPGIHLMFDYPRPRAVGAIATPTSPMCGRWGFTSFHPIFYYGTDPYNNQLANGFTSYFPGFHVTKEGLDHPCQKPLVWMQWLVKRGSKPGETVLDPFAGVFTTGVACLLMGRPFIGIEIDPYFWEQGCRRLEAAYAQPDLFLPLASTRPQQLTLSP